MKIMNKIGMIALAAGVMTSCAVNDQFGDFMELGQTVPTVSWELGSATCKAGSEATFKAKYYFQGKDDMIDHTEVWALVSRTQSAAATCKLTTGLSYTKTVNTTDTVRALSLMRRYEHKSLEWNADKSIADYNKVYAEDGQWEDAGGKYNSDYHIDMTNGYEYVLTASFPTSQTLIPVTWNNPQTFDAERFDQLYPEDFKDEFKATVINYLTKDSLYYSDVRKIYLTYDFTTETLSSLAAKNNVNFPTEAGEDAKKDLWVVDTEKVTGKYYIEVKDGVTYYKEVPLDYTAPEGVTLYDVYQAPEWVFCRYSDDAGAILTSIRASYIPFFKDLLASIPFEDWIYGADGSYGISFSREYKMVPFFKAVDVNGKVGTTTNDKELSLN